MQNFKQRYIMLFASPYSIENDNGTKNEGVSAYFVMDDNLSPKLDSEAAGRGQTIHGIKPVKMTMPYATTAKLLSAPAVYDVTLKMVVSRKTDARGNSSEIPTMQVVDIEFVSNIEVKQAK